MAPKRSSIILNVEQFIRDVEERPAIWNRNYHCNKPFLEQMWEELSEVHKLPKVVLKAKWKGLRDNFRVEYKRIPRNEATGEFAVSPELFESKWIHYYSLLFLTEHMRHRLPKADLETFYFPQSSQDYEKTIVEPDLTNGLIRIPNSDEEFDEDDEEYDDVDLNVGKVPLNKSIETTNFKNIVPTDYSKEKDKEKEKLNGELEKNIIQYRPSSPQVYPLSLTTKANSISSNNDSLNCSSNDNLNFTKSSYTNGIIPSIKLKRPRLSEDSNFNGSSTMDHSPQVPEDDDYHYLLSLLPYMKQLNAAQKLRIRTKIQKLIFKELYKEDIEETK